MNNARNTPGVTNSAKSIPGLRLLGRGDAGDSEEDRLRDDCCPGIASSASSIIRFCTDIIADSCTETGPRLTNLNVAANVLRLITI